MVENPGDMFTQFTLLSVSSIKHGREMAQFLEPNDWESLAMEMARGQIRQGGILRHGNDVSNRACSPADLAHSRDTIGLKLDRDDQDQQCQKLLSPSLDNV